jgi:hypothetical protein
VAVKFMESFDGVSTFAQLTNSLTTFPTVDKWGKSGTSGTITIDASGRTGQCLRCTTSTGVAVRTKALGLGTTAYIGFAFKAGTVTDVLGTSSPLLSLWDGSGAGAGEILSLRKSATGLIGRVGGGGDVIPVVSGILSTTEFNYFEVKLVMANSNGIFEIRRNGVVVANWPGDTLWAGASIEAIQFFANSAPGGSGYTDDRVDDVYVDDAQYRGVSRIDCIRPSGNGNSSQGVGSDADSTDNYQHVDEQSVNDADYVTFSADDEKDTYVHGDLPAAAGYAVQAVQVTTRAAYLGAAKKLAVVNRESGVEQDSADITLTNTLSNHFAVLPTAPGSAPWTDTLVNNSEFGYKQKA